MLAHVFCEDAHADGGEKIDRKPRLPAVVLGEYAVELWLQCVLPHALGQFFHTHGLGKFFKEDLDENTTGRAGVFFIHLND